MSRMVPHKAKPEIAMSTDIQLVFTPDAITKIQYYIEECDKEIGWLGTVQDVGYGTFLCDDVYLLHQEVHSATTEITTEGLVAYAEEYGDDVVTNTHLWGHSHVNMSVGPSGQDKEQMELFRENGCKWFFRIIGNKRGEIGVTYFNWQTGFLVTDVQWSVHAESSVSRDAVIQEIGIKVKEKTYGQSCTWQRGNNVRHIAPQSDIQYSAVDDIGYYMYEKIIDGEDMSRSYLVQKVMKEYKLTYEDLVAEVEDDYYGIQYWQDLEEEELQCVTLADS